MEWILLIVLVICGGLYLTDRKGWNSTAKRLSRIVRAHLESAKPLKQIEKQSEQKALDAWTAEFKGETPKTVEKHVIVKTYYATYGYSLLPHFLCKCGYSYWGLDTKNAKDLSEKHVREQNAAEEMKSQNGGTHAW